MKKGPMMHTVYSKSGRRKPHTIGINDKGRQRNSSMGGDLRKGGRFQGVR